MSFANMDSAVGKFFLEDLVDLTWIRFPATVLHNLANEKTKQFLFATPIFSDLTRIGFYDGIDESLDR